MATLRHGGRPAYRRRVGFLSSMMSWARSVAACLTSGWAWTTLKRFFRMPSTTWLATSDGG
jgi:hypothetical protein